MTTTPAAASADLTEEQREARRTRARDLIEARLTETWPAWRRPGRKPNLPLAADIALDALGDLAAELLVDGTMMRSLTIKDGVATLELVEATEMVRIFAAGMRGCLDGHGASNYVEMEMTDGTTGQGYTVTVQRRERPTPHQFRQQAEARAEQLAAALREVLGTFGPMRDVYGGPVSYYDGSADIEPEQYERWRAVLGTTEPQPALAVAEEPQFAGTRQCGHDDYHDAHEWADPPHIWCPGHSLTEETGR